MPKIRHECRLSRRISLVFLNKFTGRVPQEICWICKLTSFSSGEFPWISSLSFPRLHLLLFSLSGCLMIKMLDLPDRSKLFFFSRLFSTPLASHSFFSGTFSQPLSQNFYWIFGFCYNSFNMFSSDFKSSFSVASYS